MESLTVSSTNARGNCSPRKLKFMINNQAKVPNLETRQRHTKNAQPACQELEAFTVALNDLIAQLKSEIDRQPRNTRH